MPGLRRWDLHAEAPFAPQIAADARLSRTNFLDDQSWQLAPAVGDSPALALQSRYGGRVGLVSLVPMWVKGTQVIYQAQTYTASPVINAFAPGYLQLSGKSRPN